MTPSEFEFQVELAIAICKDKGTMPPVTIHVSADFKNELIDSGLIYYDDYDDYDDSTTYLRYKGMAVSWSSMFKDKFELVDTHMTRLITV